MQHNIELPAVPERSATSPATPEVGAPLQATPPQPSGGPVEIGGPTGPEPTRFGDWEKGGRCIDF
ncbi:MAG: DUF1674 domain-containing protein [Steroidobacteraceae bacterium]